MTARVSVVVPIYNVEDCLEWCLASLRAQTLDDIEILAVNDGSTDGSRAVLARCAAEDPRIRIIDKENGGLSSARNAGILAASAPIVCFLDSDDRFAPEACARIVSAFEEGGPRTDVVTFGAVCYPAEAGYPWLMEHLSPRDTVYDPFAPALLFEEMSRPFAWRTACRTDFLREGGLLFDEGVRFGEDQVFHFAVYPRARRTVLLSDKLYEYRVAREGSLMALVASDPVRKMTEHVPIMAAIFDDWDGAGLLGAYGSQLVAEYVDFALGCILDLGPDEREALRGPAAAVLRAHFDGAELAALDLAPATRAIVDAFLGEGAIPSARARMLRLAYYRQQHGWRAIIGRVLGR